MACLPHVLCSLWVDLPIARGGACEVPCFHPYTYKVTHFSHASGLDLMAADSATPQVFGSGVVPAQPTHCVEKVGSQMKRKRSVFGEGQIYGYSTEYRSGTFQLLHRGLHTPLLLDLLSVVRPSCMCVVGRFRLVFLREPFMGN